MDDRKFFPRYDAVWVYRADLAPLVLDSLKRLEGRISESKMLGPSLR